MVRLQCIIRLQIAIVALMRCWQSAAAGVIRPLSAFLRDWTENIYMAGQAGSGNVMYMYTVCVTDMSMAIIVMMTMAFMLSFVSAGKYWQ